MFIFLQYISKVKLLLFIILVKKSVNLFSIFLFSNMSHECNTFTRVDRSVIYVYSDTVSTIEIKLNSNNHCKLSQGAGLLYLFSSINYFYPYFMIFFKIKNSSLHYNKTLYNIQIDDNRGLPYQMIL